MEKSTEGLNPPRRVRTGDFDESFAREANKRRKQRQPIRLVRPLRSTASSQKARHHAWYRRASGKFRDEEDPGLHEELDGKPIQNLLQVGVSCRCVPFGSRSPLLFLTTKEDSPSLETRDIRWLHIQHTGIRFEEFVNSAIENARVPPATKGAIKDWLSSLQSQLESSVSTGMTFPGTVKGSMFASARDEDKEPTVSDTCLFMTLPYFLLSEGKFPHKGGQSHPVRALVESLYRNESPFSREFSQAVNRLRRSETGKVIYVPQMWCLLINNEYIATCAPTQLHTSPTSYITTVPGDEYPASVRLRLRWGLTFCIKLDECKTWFDFLLKVHYIYSHVLRMHVDVENCTYFRGSRKIDADEWELIVLNANVPGILIDINILLPNENSDWGRPIKRKIQQEYVETSGLALNKAREAGVDPESLQAFGVARSRFDYSEHDDMEFDESISLALLDKIRDHTETRIRLQTDSSRSSERQRSTNRYGRSFRRQNSPSYDSSESAPNDDSDRWHFSESDNSITRYIRRYPPRMHYRNVHTSGYPRPGRLVPHGLGVSPCDWPGCYGKGDRQRREVIRDTAFWAPREVTQAHREKGLEDKPPGYLEWPIYSGAKDGFEWPHNTARRAGAFRKNSEQDLANNMNPPQSLDGNAGPVVIDTSPMAHIDKSLRNRKLYRLQIPEQASELQRLLLEFQSASSGRSPVLIALMADAKDLVEHFIPRHIFSPIKESAFGALYDIALKCRYLDDDALKRRGIKQASKEMGKALLVSQSIKQGVHGREDDVFLLKSLVNALENLVLWLVEFNYHLRWPSKPTDPDVESIQDTANAPNAMEVEGANNDARACDVQPRETAQSPDETDSQSGIVVARNDTIATDVQSHKTGQSPDETDSQSGIVVVRNDTITTDVQSHETAQSPDESDSQSGIVVARNDKMTREAQSRRTAQPPNEIDVQSGTKIYPEEPLSGRNPRERRRSGKRVSLTKLNNMKRNLESAKTELLGLLEYQKPLDLASYSTVNTSGNIASVISSLVYGDCDLPLSLDPENAYLASIFRTSASNALDSVMHLDLGGIYQEYCSKLRLAVRDHPARNLLDDLGLAEEELDSIINVTENQQRIIKDFMSQSPHCLPTQNAWVRELDAAHRMLEDKVWVYRDLKVLIDKLRNQVKLQVELKQDNNNKAILVFTTVTVIFLPLSFMTSYFGMNTPDIRDMATGQWIFWAIAAPVTVFVAGFCMTVAYQGYKVQEYFRRL
ncbi:CorA-like Mg2+ transporter protein [Aspergillus sclerotialis]|uniref:CorA-like Mg2+ transporter protein n=1 Tax=Aspergillus sclerotialis TaxID=2070753 RepID=A0A3A2ZDL0_9EURO|nr:CorA-like Mg2+ transporter protein [Aspergillus sclerotialis]